MRIMRVKQSHKFVLHNFLSRYTCVYYIKHETLKCINKNRVNFSRGRFDGSHDFSRAY